MPDSFHGYTLSEFRPYNDRPGAAEIATVSDSDGRAAGFLCRYGGVALAVDQGLGEDIAVTDVEHALSLLAQLDCVIAAAGNLPLAITALQALQSE